MIERRIPGQDGADDAERLASRIGVVVDTDIDRISLNRVDQATVEFEILGGRFDFRASHRSGLAGLAAFDRNESLDALSDLSRHLSEDPTANDGPQVPPRRERKLGGADCGIDVGGAAARYSRDDPAGFGVTSIKVEPSTGKCGATVDEVIQLNGCHCLVVPH